MPRLLLADAEQQLVVALTRALEQVGHEVRAAGTGADAVATAATWLPDLVVVDGQLPDCTALDVIQRLRPWCEAPILVLSEIADESRKIAALNAGADDYLQKPFGMPELMARLHALERRGTPSAVPVVLRFPGLDIDLAARRAVRADQEIRLTPTEWRILEAFATHSGKLLTHGWLLRTVWDSSYGNESRQSLRAHVRALRAKLGDDAHDPRYIRTESGVGYRWLPEPLVAGAPGAPGAAGERVADGQGLPGSGRAPDAIVHDLNNVLTAMRLNAFLGDRGQEAGGGRDAVSERWTSLVQRASALVVELQQR